MKWYFNLIALCAALATASPILEKTTDSPNSHRATFALDERGGCSDNKESCCCLCAAAEAWPCIGCSGVSKFHKSMHSASFFFWLTVATIIDQIMPLRRCPRRGCLPDRNDVWWGFFPCTRTSSIELGVSMVYRIISSSNRMVGQFSFVNCGAVDKRAIWFGLSLLQSKLRYV